MKNLIKNIIFKILILSFLIITYICISAVSYANAVSSDISDAVLRLHVVANSDTYRDQELKLKVRDSLLEYMNSISYEVNTKSEAFQIVESHLNDFESIAQKIILSEGFDYSVNVHLDKFDFPTKNYGDVSLPAGIYDSLIVDIGAGAGHNWWCVMFPPLCFIDVSSGFVPDESKEVLKDSLEDDEYDIITADNSSPSASNIKFKIVEFVEQLRSKT